MGKTVNLTMTGNIKRLQPCTVKQQEGRTTRNIENKERNRKQRKTERKNEKKENKRVVGKQECEE